MSPHCVAKLDAWLRAGLLHSQRLREMIASVETGLAVRNWPWVPEASADLDELRSVAEEMERLGS